MTRMTVNKKARHKLRRTIRMRPALALDLDLDLGGRMSQIEHRTCTRRALNSRRCQVCSIECETHLVLAAAA